MDLGILFLINLMWNFKSRFYEICILNKFFIIKLYSKGVKNSCWINFWIDSIILVYRLVFGNYSLFNSFFFFVVEYLFYCFKYIEIKTFLNI